MIPHLPGAHHLGLLRHCPSHIRVIPGWPQFILIYLIRGKGGTVNDLPPGPERAVLHAGTLVVIKKARQGVIRVLGIGPYVHGPLGGIIAVKLLLFHRSALNAPGLFAVWAAWPLALGWRAPEPPIASVWRHTRFWQVYRAQEEPFRLV